MINSGTYKNKNNLKIEVNNKNHLKVELIETDEKEFNQYLKITRINEKGIAERTEFINESDIVTLWNLYIFKKEHNEPLY